MVFAPPSPFGVVELPRLCRLILDVVVICTRRPAAADHRFGQVLVGGGGNVEPAKKLENLTTQVKPAASFRPAQQAVGDEGGCLRHRVGLHAQEAQPAAKDYLRALSSSADLGITGTFTGQTV